VVLNEDDLLFLGSSEVVLVLLETNSLSIKGVLLLFKLSRKGGNGSFTISNSLSVSVNAVVNEFNIIAVVQ